MVPYRILGLGVSLLMLSTRGIETDPDASEAKDTTAEVDSESMNLVLRDLWGGVDFHDGSFSFTSLARKLPGDTSDAAERGVQVMGLQDTGTDLLKALLYINFGFRLNYHAMPPEEGSPNGRKGIWKHANLKELWQFDSQLAKSLQEEDVYAIMVVRDPLSWLQAVRRMPRELGPCVNGGDWLTRTCTHNKPGGYNSKVGAQTYSSLVAVWNQFNDGFQNSERYGFPHRLILKYEDLISNPKEALDKVAHFLGIEPTVWAIPPDDVDGTGQKSAKVEIESRSYLDKFVNYELKQACDRVSKELLNQYGYECPA